MTKISGYPLELGLFIITLTYRFCVQGVVDQINVWQTSINILTELCPCSDHGIVYSKTTL